MIRKAEVNDIAKINELGKIINDNFDVLYNIEEMLNDNYSAIYVYTIDEEVVGFLSATVLPDTADILDVVVDSNYRRKRIATNLLDYFISDLDKKVQLITLEVRVNNEAAIELYSKFGFEIVNIRKKYYKNGDDAYLMGRSTK